MTDRPEAEDPEFAGRAAAANERLSAHRRIEDAAVARFEARPRDTRIRRTGRADESHEPAPTTEWIVIVPVKGTTDAKSRFGGDAGARTALAAALALDTLDAVGRAAGVVAVLVVTSPDGAAVLDEADVLVLVEDEPAGLAGAIALAVETAASMGAPGRGTAVLLGDLPALRPDELATALAAARDHDRAFVRDAAGTGTTLVTAADGAAFTHAFGPGSAAAHAADGLVELAVAVDSGLRRDVDTRVDLRALAHRVGPRTAALLADD